MDSQSGSFEKLKATKTFDEKLDDQLKDLKGKESEKLMAQFVELHKRRAKLDDMPMDAPSERCEKIKVTTVDTKSFNKLQLENENFDKLEHRDDYHQICFVDQSKEHEKEEACVKRFTTPGARDLSGRSLFPNRSRTSCARDFFSQG